MGKDTTITWAHDTFNPWVGCVEVSPACDHCYASAWSDRFRHGLWGKDAPRRVTRPAYWREPMAWNRDADQAGERRRVFCASLADVLEQRGDAVGAELDAARARLWDLIRATPSLDWLLLSK